MAFYGRVWPCMALYDLFMVFYGRISLFSRSWIQIHLVLFKIFRVKEILADIPEGRLNMMEFQERFKEIYNEDIDEEQIRTDLKDLVRIIEEEPETSLKSETPLKSEISSKSAEAEENKENNNSINVESLEKPKKGPEIEDEGLKIEVKSAQNLILELVPLQLCGIRIQNLLKENGDKMLMSEFEAAFAEKFGTALCPGQYGYPGLANLISGFPEYLSIRGRGTKKMICFLREGRKSPQPRPPTQPLQPISRYFL